MMGVVVTLAGFLGEWSWLLELTTHFRVQLAAALGLIAMACALGRRWKSTTVLSATVLLNAVPVVWEARPRGPEPPANIRPLRLMSVNVHTANTRFDLVLAAIRQIQPDVILLLEVDSRWIDGVQGLRSDYPNAVIEDRDDNFGIALFSRLPFLQSQILDLGEVGVPSVEVNISYQGSRVTFLGTHPVPPGGRQYSAERNRQLKAIGDWAQKREGPLVVMGDLNCTPWSPDFQLLTASGTIQIQRPQWGLQASWPVPQPLLRIPIDHCLTSRDVGVVRRELGPDVGSDHFPLWVEVTLPKGP